MIASLQISIVLGVLAVLLVPGTVLAYGGPGSVISGIGAFLAAVAALLASLLGFIWFPLKRLYKSLTAEDSSTEEVEANQSSE